MTSHLQKYYLLYVIFILMMFFHVLIENKPSIHKIVEFARKSYAGPLLKKKLMQLI